MAQNISSRLASVAYKQYIYITTNMWGYSRYQWDDFCVGWMVSCPKDLSTIVNYSNLTSTNHICPRTNHHHGKSRKNSHDKSCLVSFQSSLKWPCPFSKPRQPWWPPKHPQGQGTLPAPRMISEPSGDISKSELATWRRGETRSLDIWCIDDSARYFYVFFFHGDIVGMNQWGWLVYTTHHLRIYPIYF